MREPNERLATLEANYTHIIRSQEKADERHDDMDKKLDTILALIDEGRGFWRAGKLLAAVIVALWSAVVATVTDRLFHH